MNTKEFDVKSIRMQAGMGIQEFADAMGVSRQSISAYENGKTNPKKIRSKLEKFIKTNDITCRSFTENEFNKLLADLKTVQYTVGCLVERLEDSVE